MLWFNRTDNFLNLVEIFFPEFLLFVGIFIYMASFFFILFRNYFYNFVLYFSILFTILIGLFYAPTRYNFECYLISTNLIWITKLFLISFVILFTISHFLQVRFALLFNNYVDLELGSKYFEYNLILLVLLLSSYLTITSNDFILFLVGLEVISISLYILTSLTYERIAVESALKYFFPGIFFSLIIVLGVVFIFWSYGRFNFFEIKDLMYRLDELATSKIIKLYDYNYIYINNNFTVFKILIDKSSLENSNLISTLDLKYLNSDDFLVLYDFLIFSYFPNIFNHMILSNNSIVIFDFFKDLFLQKLKWLFIGFCLIFFGLLGKLGVFPGHFWVLDVYSGTSTLSNFFLSIFPKIVYLILLIKFRLIFSFLFEYTPINLIFIVSGVISIWYGLSVTLNQWRVKRFLAGSSIVNIGFIILFFGFDTNFSYNLINLVLSNNLRKNFFLIDFEGYTFLQFTIIYFNLLIYLITMIIFFYFYLILRMPSSVKKTYYLEDLREFNFLKNTNIKFLVLFGLIFLSLAGIPPLSGFFSKFLVFEFAFLHKYYFILIFLILSSIIAVFYYIRIVRHFFFNSLETFKLFKYENNFFLNFFFVCSVIFLFLIIFGFNFFILNLFDILIKDLFFLIFF